MDLRTAILKAKQTFGVDVIYERKIISILDDYGVFRYKPAYRFIIKELIQFKGIREYAKASDERRKMITLQIVNNFGFNKDLVQDVFDSFWNYDRASFQKENSDIDLLRKTQEFKDGIFAFRENGKWGWMGINGNVAIEPKYNWVSSFVDGLAKFSTNGFWDEGLYNPITIGCIDFLGNIIIPEEYESICLSRYKNEVVLVKKNGKCGIINKFGKFIVPCKYNGIAECANNIFRTEITSTLCDGKKTLKYGIILMSGEVLCEPIYDYVWGGSFSKGHPYAIVKSGDKFLVLDHNGKCTSSFSSNTLSATKCNNIFIIRLEGQRYGLISVDGSIIIDCIYEKIAVDTETIIAYRDGFWEIFNTIGVKISAIKLISAYLHDNTIYGKTQDGQCVKISKDGVISYLPLRDIHYVFKNGYIAATSEVENSFYKTSLSIYDPFLHKTIRTFCGGYIIKTTNEDSLNNFIEISIQGELSDSYFFNTNNGNMFFHYGNNGCGTFGWTKYEIMRPLQKTTIIKQKHYSASGELDNHKYFIVDFESGSQVGYYKDSKGELNRRFFDAILSFKYGIAVYKANGKYGYINEQGEITIRAKFDFAESFKDKFAIIVENGFYSVIDRTGHNVIENLKDMIQNIQYPIEYGKM